MHDEAGQDETAGEIADADRDDESPGTSAAPPAIRVRGRSFMALVLTPDAPLDRWIEALDAEIRRAASFFVGRPVVLDLGLLGAGTPGLAELPALLRERAIRVIATEGDAARDLPEFPDPLSGGRATGEETIPGPEQPSEPEPEVETTAPSVTSLMIEEPVRSGRQVIFAEGDVTVLGSVASGAEVLAGGSIHVYGTLRGRAIAGFGGRADARVICRKLDAELVAIDGYYLTAEDMGEAVLGRPAQAFLEGGQVVIRVLK